jgi:hypothetical protein
VLLREQFGDLDRARDVLGRLAAALEALEQPEPAPDDTQQQKATPAGRRRRKEQRR